MKGIASKYDTTFSVIRSNNTKDAGGALIEQEHIESSGNLGKLDALSGSRTIRDGKGTILANYVLFCNEMQIAPTDSIKITACIDANLVNQTMEIHQVNGTTLRGRNPHMEIYLAYGI